MQTRKGPSHLLAFLLLAIGTSIAFRLRALAGAKGRAESLGMILYAVVILSLISHRRTRLLGGGGGKRALIK